MLAAAVADAAPSVPYTDPRAAAGYIGLCNQQGQQVTSGSIDTAPFVWRAVSTVAAPSGVSGTGRTATLYAYQPMQGLPAQYWSGEQITGTAQYSNPSFPTVVSTARDLPLSNFLNTFHPQWDGFIELRLYLDAPGSGLYVDSYATLNLYISGDQWQAVGGGSVNCNSGQAVSDEAALPGASGATSTTVPSSKSGSATNSNSNSNSPTTTTTSDPPPAGTSAPASHSAPGSSGSRVGTNAAASTALSPSNSSSNTVLIAAVAAAAVVVAVGAAVFIRRRRRAAP